MLNQAVLPLEGASFDTSHALHHDNFKLSDLIWSFPPFLFFTHLSKTIQSYHPNLN